MICRFAAGKNKYPTPIQKGGACLELLSTFTCERLYHMLHELNDGFSNIKKRCTSLRKYPSDVRHYSTKGTFLERTNKCK